MCQKRTDSQKPLSGAWAKVQGHATAQLQLSNQSPVICQLGISAMGPPFASHRLFDTDRDVSRCQRVTGPRGSLYHAFGLAVCDTPGSPGDGPLTLQYSP